MSGIAGYLGSPQPPSVLRSMMGKMMHRGATHVQYYEQGAVSLGVRQLDGDFSLVGERCYVDAERDTAIVLAGEFTNYREELEQLEKKGVRLTGATMAEVALRLYEVYGVSCVNRMRGAFVLAIHDPQKDLAFIARDPLGVKPLYYATTQSGTFVFASEIKSLFEHPGVSLEADLRGIDAYLSMGCSPGPDAMFKGVHKLPAGHRVLWNPGLHVMIEPYWQVESFAKPDPVLKTDEDFEARFASLFEEAVRQHAVDGFGIYLSGDIESAAVAAVLAKNSSSPVTAFCYDASSDVSAAAVAAQLGCKAETVNFLPQDMDKFPEAIWALDEPVADISLMPFYIAARMARPRGALVTGNGGAEMFASLPFEQQLLNAIEKPKAFYSALKSLYALAPQASMARKLGFEGRVGPRTKQRLFDVVEALRAGSLWRQYLSVAGILDQRDKQALYIGDMIPVMETYADTRHDPEGWPSATGAIMAIENASGLPEGVLAPVEKIGMFSSTECRLPFMDHRLAEFLIGLPDHLRRTKGRDRILLRKYLDKAHPGLIPPAAVSQPERRSLLAECLAAEPLKGMVETCLSESSVRRRELFDWQAVKALLAGAKTDEPIYARQVFALLSLEIWFRIFVDHEKGWMSH